MANPSLERENTLPSSSGPTATLTITRTLVVADGRGAQLVICSIAPKTSQTPFEAVAKIFDALYYPGKSQEGSHVPRNAAKLADIDCTHEAAALDHLRQTGQTGLSAPKYFGSWTFTLPITYRLYLPLLMLSGCKAAGTSQETGSKHLKTPPWQLNDRPQLRLKE
jgi:hypothetical protein